MITALYRRYRPDTFEQVIGQDHVVKPLMAALASGRINHAYLFSGPRGCGKTTSARIMARCLNCEQGPTPTPCGTCASCVDLATGGPGSVDVVEMDAASHNTVDHARELTERAAFAPVRDRFKIYILDEAHMVTPQGFNAMLKLVEEPPAHVKFIFATTEPEKVIGTIRSRTHHYPFRLVPPEQLRHYLEQLCEAENITPEQGVLGLVVRAGGGSVRDTLSVLDQLMASAQDGQITYARAIALLGYTDTALLDEMVQALAAADGPGVFQVVDRIVEGGHDPRRFVEDLLERLRDLIVIALAGQRADDILAHLPAGELARMRPQAGAFGARRLTSVAQMTNEGLSEMVGASSPRLLLELLVARLLLAANPGSGGPTGSPVPVPAVSVSPASAVPVQTGHSQAHATHAPAAQDPVPQEPKQQEATAQEATIQETAAPMGTGESQEAASPGAQTMAPSVPVAQVTDPKPAPKVDQWAEDSWANFTPAGANPTGSNPTDTAASAQSSAAASPASTGSGQQMQNIAPVSPAGSAGEAAGSRNELLPTRVRQRWEEILGLLSSVNKAAWSFVQNASIGKMDGEYLELVFASEGMKNQFPRFADFISHGISAALNQPVQIKAVVANSTPAPVPPGTAGGQQTPPIAQAEQTTQAAQTAPAKQIEQPVQTVEPAQPPAVSDSSLPDEPVFDDEPIFDDEAQFSPAPQPAPVHVAQPAPAPEPMPGPNPVPEPAPAPEPEFDPDPFPVGDLTPPVPTPSQGSAHSAPQGAGGPAAPPAPTYAWDQRPTFQSASGQSEEELSKATLADIVDENLPTPEPVKLAQEILGGKIVSVIAAPNGQ